MAIGRINATLSGVQPGGLAKIVPTSVVVGSGSGSVNANGLVTFSGASSVSVNDVFSSTYDHYFYIISAKLATGTGALTVRLRVSGTDTSANYQSDRILQQSTTVSGASDSTGTDDLYFGEVTDYAEPFFVGHILNPFAVNRTYHQGRNTLLDGNGNLIQFMIAGAHTDSTSFTGLTLIPTASNITGTIRIYGYN